MKKKALAILLTIAIMVTFMPGMAMTAFAEELLGEGVANKNPKVTLTYEKNLGSVTHNANNLNNVPSGTAITFTATANDGCTFVKWVVDDNDIVGGTATYTLTVSKDCSIKAVFEQNETPPETEKHKVTFTYTGPGSVTASIDNKSISSGDEVEKGKNIVFKAQAKGNATFDSWMYDGDKTSTNPELTLKVDDTDIIVTALFLENNKKNVIFNANRGTIDGDLKKVVSTNGNGYINNNVIPTAVKNNVKCIGWTTEADNKETIIEDLTTYTFTEAATELYALWPTSKVEFSVADNHTERGLVTAVANSKPITSGEYVEQGETVLFIATAYPLYKFASWNGINSQKATAEIVVGENDIDARAVFDYLGAPPKDVTYHSNTVPEEKTTVSASSGTYTISDCEFDNGDKVFAYWTTCADGTGDVYYAGDVISGLSNDMDLYAQWVDDGYGMITVYITDAAEDSPSTLRIGSLMVSVKTGPNDCKEAIFGLMSNLPAGAKAKEDKLYEDAAAKSNVSNKKITPQGKSVYIFVDPETVQFDVTYDLNADNATWKVEPEEAKKVFGQDLTLTENTPIREGYTFTSWNTLPDGRGVIYEPGATYGENANVILYAQWKKDITTEDVVIAAAAIAASVATLDAIVKASKNAWSKYEAAKVLTEAKTTGQQALNEALGGSADPIVNAFFDQGYEAVAAATTPEEVMNATAQYVNLMGEAKTVLGTKVAQNKLKAEKNGKIVVSFKNSGLEGTVNYQVVRSTSKNFNKNVKKYTVEAKDQKTLTLTNAKNLKKGTRYYYQVRAKVKLSDGTQVYTDWSNTRYVKAKKTR